MMIGVAVELPVVDMLSEARFVPGVSEDVPDMVHKAMA